MIRAAQRVGIAVILVAGFLEVAGAVRGVSESYFPLLMLLGLAIVIVAPVVSYWIPADS